MYHPQQPPYHLYPGAAQVASSSVAAAAPASAPPPPPPTTATATSSCAVIADGTSGSSNGSSQTRDMGVQATPGGIAPGTAMTGARAVTVTVSAPVASVPAASTNTKCAPAGAAAAAEVSGESGGSRPASASPPASPNLAQTSSASSSAAPSAAATTAAPPAAAGIPAVSPPRPAASVAVSAAAAAVSATVSTNTSISIPATSTVATAPNDQPAAAATAQAQSQSATNTTTTTKKKKKRQSTESKMLEVDSREILGRIAARDSSMVSRRAFAYEPTLDIFREYGFSDYVRGALLGVDGVVDWESSDEEDSDDEDGAGEEEDEQVEKEEKEEGETGAAGTAAEPMDAATTEDGATNESDSGEQGSPKKAEELTPARKSARQAVRKSRQRKKSDPLPPERPARISARIKARSVEEEGVAGEEDGRRRGAKKCCRGHSDKKTAKAAAAEAAAAADFDPFEDMPEPNEMLLADGIAKITPPKGWWDHAGIGGDLTGRGPIWSKGGRLGDAEVTTPIKQCASGIGGVYEYTMLELPPVPVHEFRERADQYRKRQIREEHNDDTSDEYMDALARKFWKRLGPTMEASVYGADMEGTLFDGADACGWNVDRLESALALLGVDMDEEGAAPGEPAGRLPGVTTAYLYYGMWGSTFAAHTEDMNLLSINYLHAGSPKFWYAIDPKDSKRFESLATSLFPSAARDCPEFLRHKQYLISPSILSKAGISYTTQVQRAGDAIITFPNAYHFGFNSGFNVAESTNFAVPEWLPYGKSANVCLCHPHSVRIDMDRFQDLLGQYETRNARLRQLQRKRLTYSEFARAEAARRRKEEARYVSEEDDDDEEEEPIRYGSIRPVEVVQMKTSSSTPAAVARRNKGKKTTAASKKKPAQPRETWRRAKQAWPSSFREGAQVLSYVPAAAENYDEEDQLSEKCFSGTVVDACEGYVRIKFDGTQRKDDMWVKLDGRKLFLDDGPVNRDSDSEDDDSEPPKKAAAKKKPTNKKRKMN